MDTAEQSDTERQSDSNISHAKDVEQNRDNKSVKIIDPGSQPEIDLAHGDDTAQAVSEKKEKPKGWKRYLGVIYTLCAINVTGLAANILKLISHIDPVTLSLYSFPVGIILTSPWILYRTRVQKEPAMKNVLPLNQNKLKVFFMWLRASMSVLITFTLIWSIQYILVSDSRTIFASSVITVSICGCICFKEKFGIVSGIVSVIALCGIVIMTKPPILTGNSSYDKNTLIGISFAFASMLCSSVNMMALRVLHDVYHGVLNTFLFTWSFIATLPFAIALEKTVIPDWTYKDVLWLMFYGFLSSLNNTLLALALQVERVGVVALVRTCEVIFVILWQMALSRQFPDWISIIGALMVMTGVFVVGIQIWLGGKDENSPTRKRLRWLLL